MKLRFATLAFTALVLTLASTASAFPGDLRSIPAELIDNVQVTTSGTEQAAKMGFWQAGPIGVLSAKTRMTGNGRLAFYAGSKGFVVNRNGAIYDFEGGAVVKVHGGISVTGSYRLLGYDFLATGSEITEPQLSGPFLGVNLEF